MCPECAHDARLIVNAIAFKRRVSDSSSAEDCVGAVVVVKRYADMCGGRESKRGEGRSILQAPNRAVTARRLRH
eukprot:6488255-Amphidinium_carterae.1